ncbi:MAG: transcriptional regulator, CdaR family [Marmoricola sp.]|nr:transcriptional regulator, CdaR family [Marmoricola sp.]
MPGTQRPRTRAQIAQRVQRSLGKLSTAAITAMERDLPWFAELPAEDRSWVGLIVQAGIKSFVDWYRDPESISPIQAEVFGAAPQAMAGVITLKQTVDLIRLSFEVVEENIVDAIGPDDAVEVRRAIDSYAREVAFATAEVYARAAEQRGAWDARLEALVVDSVLRGEADDGIGSRASALGWGGTGNVVVLVGGLAEGSAIEEVRRKAHEHRLDCLCAVQGERLVVVLGGVEVNGSPSGKFVDYFAPGPVVIGPVVPSLMDAGRSAVAAEAGLRAVRGWPDAPRPVAADDLLPERALGGEQQARDLLIAEIHLPLKGAGSVVLETLESFLTNGSSIEATGRALYVHPNTVRYRLKRAHDITGLSPTDSRDAWILRVGLTVGRLNDLATDTPDTAL